MTGPKPISAAVAAVWRSMYNAKGNTMPKTIKDNIIRLFQDDPDAELPEVSLGVVDAPVAPMPTASAADAIDLTGKPKIVMVFGPGNSGKSTLLRFVIERATQRQGGQPLALATLDTERPTLLQYFPQAMKPPSSAAAGVWLEKLLAQLLERRVTTAIDFGADKSLVDLLSQVPDLQAAMEDAGVQPVVLYLLTPRVSDLTVLAAMETARFRPASTALVLNLGKAVSDHDPAGEFMQIRRHSTYRAIVERGAIEVWMPRLYAAKAVEDRGVSFLAAATEKEDTKRRLTLFDRSRVFHWLDLMDQAFAPIASWLP